MLLKFCKARKNMKSSYYFFSDQKGPDSGACSLQLPSPDSSWRGESTCNSICFIEGPAARSLLCTFFLLNSSPEQRLRKAVTADAHENCYHWGCTLIVIQTCFVKHTIFGFMLVNRGLKLMLIKDHKGGYAASQWDLYAESHLCFESLPKIMFQRACITLPKSSWWMSVSLNLDAEGGSSSEQSSSRLFTQSKQDGIRAFCNQYLLKTSYLYLLYFKVQ